ncbi:MAG TPA: DUF58 domain-containing protein [Candidatus Kapabacteria bacterium]|nr:DUF58 domain-containing protein [Candidatus Kapabacteria bacterium]
MEDYRKYLLPETVAQMSNLELIARLVVEGFITGLHRSPYHGFSVEFAEHRQYRPGDETRNIDWKVYARTNKYYVKQYEEETNLRSMIAIDTSASMKYKSTNNISKFEYAIYLSAALATLMIKQRDAVGVATYNDGISKYYPPNSKASYLTEILKMLSEVVPSDITSTSKALDSLAERIKRRGLVIIMSDFLDDFDSVINALKHFRHRNHEVIAFQILDPREIDFKLGQGSTFKDLETGEEIVSHPIHIQHSYSQQVKEFTNKIKNECFNHNIDYNLIDTSTPFDKAMLGYLTKRKKM